MVKMLAAILCFFVSNLSYGQTSKGRNVEIHLVAQFNPVTITLAKDGKEISSIECSYTTKLMYKSLEAGYYEIILTGPNQKKDVNDSILLKPGEKLIVAVTIDGPCLYDHPAGYIPVCPRNHTDNIIPIAYGLIGFTNKSDSTKNRVRLGGCVVTDCDPKFYCTIHKIEL